jgi:tetratricopeptide (TPR) repeat protein
MAQDPAQLLQRGVSLSERGQHADALAAYDEVLGLLPDQVEALNNRGISLIQLRRPGEAIASFDRALSIRPQFAEAWGNRGAALLETGNVEVALESFRRSLALRPDAFGSLLGAGRALARLGHWHEALARLDQALGIAPGNVDALGQRAYVLVMLKRHEEALESFGRVFAAAPPTAAQLNEYGLALVSLKRYEDALAAFERAATLQPHFPEALNNRGLTLGRLLRHKEALVCFDEALRLFPDYVGALDNRAITLTKLGRFEEALASGDEALMIQPDFAKAHLHQAMTLLRMGDYARGLRKYEWRWLDGGPPLWREFPQPLWMGRDDLRGKTILVHSEQGLGDAMQFTRYVPLLVARGARVLLAVPRVLLPLMQTLQGVERYYAWGEAVPVSDYHCPLLSLPLAFGTTLETIPGSVPYLRINASHALVARRRLAPRGGRLVGICWRGNPSYLEDRERSMRLEDLLPVLRTKGVRFVSLQKDLTAHEQRLAQECGMLHPGGDFDATAEIVAAVDLVISVDTAWAHLAGAIGKPVWIPLAPVPHWVWLSGREDSPWYPSARLFRQAEVGDWEPTVRKLAGALRGLLARR